jgi:hypothetical protein
MNIEADFIPTKDNGGLDMDIDLSRPEAALLQERAIIGRLSREELEDRSVYVQPPRLPFYRRELSLAGSPGKSWRTGQYTASEAALLQERAIIGRLSREELEDRSVYSPRGRHTS